ncbi:TPA: transposase [Burkholderia aenigmatica]|uniref:transposase n=1 Tax=Burkholderia sp. AU45251 TaxID=3059204 RepID=UPI0026546BCF|nr:transposase [Burkholderia sp. AU45251]HDR9487703.1 transposase [Burkholderia aenigmatica]MDN7520523.1 transposase [Burkholderia sp. AU45251]HDR9519481.1 transposase [Burkholderia aenigmatica]HDR9596511.1 transposase [Burkholderia aenigmatica]HDR9603888.1 transposase [Burkholderia aenigmatica]
MSKHECNAERINAMPDHAEAGPTANKLYRKHGIADDGLDAWRARLGSGNTAEARRVRQLEDENTRLKLLVADQALDIKLLWEVVSGKNVQSDAD